MAGVESMVRTSMGAGVRPTIAGATAGRRGAVASLPAPGERLTEDQVRRRFSTEGLGSIRVSRASKTIVLVDRADARAQPARAVCGRHILFSGRHDPDSGGLARQEDLILANSGRDGYDVLYFVKDSETLAYVGRVECVSSMPAPGGDDGQVRGASFMLRLARGERNARGLPPDASLDSIEMVEGVLSSARGFGTRRALLESLPLQVSSGSLDRILEYLARSGKVDVEGGSVRWIFADRPAAVEADEIAEGAIETLDILANPDLAMQIRESEADLLAGRVVPWAKGRAQNTRQSSRSTAIASTERPRKRWMPACTGGSRPPLNRSSPTRS